MNMKKHIILILAAIVYGTMSISAQQTPAAAQTEAISITGAMAHLGNGQVIDNSIE